MPLLERARITAQTNWEVKQRHVYYHSDCRRHRSTSRSQPFHLPGATSYVAWLIRGRDLNVLADTGCSADAYGQHIPPAGGALMVLANHDPSNVHLGTIQ